MNEFELRDKLKEERENINSFDELISFLQNVKENCNCGYGEAPRAIAQAALATAWYLSSEFGITGFQASFVMWDFILDWQYRNNKCGLKMINYDDMLYPQYEHKFEKTLSTDTFEALQKEASKLFEDSKGAHPEVLKHWKSIVDGKVPFGYMLEDRWKNQFDWEDDMSLFNKEPILKLEYAYIDDSKPRNEFEIKDKIVGELQKLKSDKVGHINTINIDHAIEIVREA